MADIYARSERMKLRWRDQAEEDPLTGLPNLRALESHLQRNPAVAISSLRIQNLDFLSRHYGMMMRVESKRQIARKLQPLLAQGERIYQLPGSELLLVLNGPEPEARLNHIVSTLNHKSLAGTTGRWIWNLAHHGAATAVKNPSFIRCSVSLAGYRSRPGRGGAY